VLKETAMTDSDVPQYVNRWGFQGSLQPFICPGLSSYSFILRGKLPNIQNLCDHYLNQPTGDQVKYFALSPYVILTMTQISSLMAVNPPYRTFGKYPETEVALRRSARAGSSSEATWPGLRRICSSTCRTATAPAIRQSSRRPLEIVAFHSGKILSGSYRFTLEDLASHPVAKDLGLNTQQPVSLSYWMQFDYKIGDGLTIWTAPSGQSSGSATRKRLWPAIGRAKSQNQSLNGQSNRRKKIVILGGGVGALTTAFQLTDPEQERNWKDCYDITVYQLGWRLGGKGASGRNQNISNRIEEHGLHVWFGYYYNAFKMIKQCYKELGRPSGAPLAT
jgi:hypothetical protein